MALTKRRRRIPEQIIRKLQEGERRLADGQELAQVAKRLEVALSTSHGWMAQYAGTEFFSFYRATG